MNISKRSSHINEEELIQHVKMRPFLYDRTIKGKRKSCVRQNYWKEIAQKLDATDVECRRRWRSLRDAFSKHYKYNNRHQTEPEIKRKKWVFYDQMFFMAPYLDSGSDIGIAEFVDYSDNDDNVDDEQPTASKSDVNKANEPLQQSSVEHIVCAQLNDMEVKPQITSIRLQANKEQRSKLAAEQEESQNSTNMDESTLDSQHIFGISNECPSALAASVENRFEINSFEEPTISNTAAVTTMHQHDQKHSSCMHLDSDESFLLSCAPIMRRLTKRQNSWARLKIQLLLFDLEFGDQCSTAGTQLPSH